MARKAKVIKVGEEEVLQRQTKEAIEKGRLPEFCHGAYGKEISEFFCKECSVREICEAQSGKERKNKDKNSSKK
jgi:hypothetical protein